MVGGGVFEVGKSGAGGWCYSGIVWRRPPEVGVKSGENTSTFGGGMPRRVVQRQCIPKVGVKTDKIAPTFGEEMLRRAVQGQCPPKVGEESAKNTPTSAGGVTQRAV